MFLIPKLADWRLFDDKQIAEKGGGNNAHFKLVSIIVHLEILDDEDDDPIESDGERRENNGHLSCGTRQRSKKTDKGEAVTFSHF